jgi:TIR domain
MAPRASSLTPTFWLPGHLRLFITHLSKHKKQAGLLQDKLLVFQISSFIAHNDIEPTKKWQDEIELALSTADALVALLTPGFHGSQWTDQEIGFALGRSLPILTIRLGVDPYGFLAREQAIQGKGVHADTLAQSVFSVFLKNKQTRKRLTESVVQRFIASDSFFNAKDNFTLLEKIEYWDEHLAKAVKSAVKLNSQIGDAWGLPARVAAFLKRMNSER